MFNFLGVGFCGVMFNVVAGCVSQAEAGFCGVMFNGVAGCGFCGVMFDVVAGFVFFVFVVVVLVVVVFKSVVTVAGGGVEAGVSMAEMLGVLVCSLRGP